MAWDPAGKWSGLLLWNSCPDAGDLRAWYELFGLLVACLAIVLGMETCLFLFVCLFLIFPATPPQLALRYFPPYFCYSSALVLSYSSFSKVYPVSSWANATSMGYIDLHFAYHERALTKVEHSAE